MLDRRAFIASAVAMSAAHATAAAAAYKTVLMALDDSHVKGNDGIVEDSVDASIGNLCALACESIVNKAC